MFVPGCDRPAVANPMGPRERTLWRQGEPQFTEKYRHRYANSPLLDLPIMQVMGDAHYLQESPLPKMPGCSSKAVARRAPGRALACALLPRRLHAPNRDR